MFNQMLAIALIAEAVAVMLCGLACAMTQIYVASEIERLRVSAVREPINNRMIAIQPARP